MQFVISKQIAVEAETPEEAVAKMGTEGKTISFTVSPRPNPVQRPNPNAPQFPQVAPVPMPFGRPQAQG